MKNITYGVGGFDPTKPNNNIIEELDLPDPPQAPLDTLGVIATLNAVLGVWTVQDAANAVGLTPAELESEAQAWYVAANDPV